MTVKITKPALNIREELSNLKKPSGAAGEAVLRAETPQEQFALIGAGRRNILINGGFTISQRASYSSATAATSNNYYLDRWNLDFSGVSATIQSNSTDLPNGTTAKTAKLAATSTATGYLQIRQKIEVESWMDNQTVTVSAWVKSNTAYPRLRVESAGIPNHQDSTHIYSGSGNWEFLTMTLPLKDAISSFSAGVILWNSGTVAISSADYVEISQVQLELGKVATPFEHRSYGEEYALCQRYYQRFDADGQDYTNIATAHGTTGSSSTKWYVPIILPGGRMRTDPAVSVSAASDFRCTLQHSNSDNCSSVAIGYGNPTTPNLAVIAGSNVAGEIRMFGFSANANGWLAFDAEI